MYCGEGSKGRPRITDDAAVLAASELAKSRTCPGDNVRGLATTDRITFTPLLLSTESAALAGLHRIIFQFWV